MDDPFGEDALTPTWDAADESEPVDNTETCRTAAADPVRIMSIALTLLIFGVFNPAA